MNCNVNAWYAGYLMCNLCEGVIRTSKGILTHRVRIAALRNYLFQMRINKENFKQMQFKEGTSFHPKQAKELGSIATLFWFQNHEGHNSTRLWTLLPQLMKAIESRCVAEEGVPCMKAQKGHCRKL